MVFAVYMRTNVNRICNQPANVTVFTMFTVQQSVHSSAIIVLMEFSAKGSWSLFFAFTASQLLNGFKDKWQK